MVALMWRGGSVIVPLKSNTMLLRGSLKFEVAGHRPTEKHQAPESFVRTTKSPRRLRRVCGVQGKY
jgi:hypothetical protein